MMALRLAPMPVVLLAKAPLQTEVSSVWAQGGIAAAVGPDDNPALHFADTLAAGNGLCDADVARWVTSAGPAAVTTLLHYGVQFDRDATGALLLGLEAAHSRRRIVHATGDGTRKEIMRALAAAVRATDSITVLEGVEVRHLMVASRTVIGALAVSAMHEQIRQKWLRKVRKQDTFDRLSFMNTPYSERFEHTPDMVRQTRRHANELRPRAKQRTRSMSIERLDVHRPIPSHAHDLCEPLGIVLVGLLHLERGTGMSRVEANHVEPALAQFMDKPWRHRASFNAGARMTPGMSSHSPLNRFLIRIDTGHARAGAQHRQRHRSTSTFAKHPNQQIGPSATFHV
jgi:hypothetical protein